MTPKEKAIELVDTMDLIIKFYQPAKQCALIAVDEILNLCWNGNLKAKEYWQEVKQEIEKL
jgi:hypothetical protein